MSVSGVEDDQDLVGLDDVVVAVDKENGEDQNGDLITTPGSSTTGKLVAAIFVVAEKFVSLSLFFALPLGYNI